MLYGYMRISTGDRTVDVQRDALVSAGIPEENIYSDTITGSTRISRRPEFEKLRERLRQGDILVVWKMDRLGRSILDLITTVFDLLDRDVTVRSITDAVDSSTPQGRALFGILDTIADLERENVRERVRAGMRAARQRGTHCGRPRMANREMAEAIREHLRRDASVRDIAQQLNISVSLIYKVLREFPDQDAEPAPPAPEEAEDGLEPMML